MKLYIKNMVCSRCKMVLEDQLQQLGLLPAQVKLGEITFEEQLNSQQIASIQEKIHPLGFEILDDKRQQTVMLIKSTLIDLVQQEQAYLKNTLSEYLTKKLNQEYPYLSHLFSQLESTTIEQYFIHLKIEKVKELLVYDELTLKEIAFQLHYSSVAHLSSQFKKTTGLTPTHFKQLGNQKRAFIENL